MKLQHSSVIEMGGARLVEMLYADQPEPGEHEAQMRFVVPVSAEKYPRIAAAQLEALQHVRNAINDEIHRLEQIRGRVFPNERWQ